ncbi:glucose 1-dehydrogenase [Pseudomonas citronellolis]|jgi:NAD(P)-dependent dehydrogenase (short-subunit alcohol dehydrogenase family)|uniref:Glucose 1-dehydrogenase n=1 Tax=Pseudomonas citronellolis TaxID=53408 RepID=A0AAW6P5W3_9PSED|nr:glucose 1-dehydrogenase [Pseudomonas citronellolis]MDF3842955.1 glucose 1-dehydrogenase [Pseudomonas citronellolis]
MHGPLFDLTGRVALVTGASSGLGRHFAGTLARAGAAVALCARREDRLQEQVATLRDQGARALAVAMDVGDAGSVRAAVQQVQDELGVVDVLVNNAGVATTEFFLDQEEASWDAVLDTNLKGAWLVAREVARRLADTGRPGSIVNIASILGERVAGASSAYATSKAALIQLSKAMALELARKNIRVNALAPGYVATELNSEFLASEAGQRLMARVPQRRFAAMEELDGPLLLLTSEAGSYVTGAVLAVDGGHLVSSL